jgi:transposase
MSYRFTDEEKEEIRNCIGSCSSKKTLKRLEALRLRAEGRRNRDISEKTGFHPQYITVLVSRYKNRGIDSILNGVQK